MYIPAVFREDDAERLRAFMRESSFALLVSNNAGQLIATHLPLLLDIARGERGSLLGHMARANPQWRSFRDGAEVLAVFQGPHAYISPSWYETGPAVPTWNYAAVHAYGTPRLIEGEDELHSLLESTVAIYEGGFERPWRLADQPERYIAGMMQAIVGFEISITRLEGKLKLSQNRSEADRAGVVAGLRRSATPAEPDIAALMEADLKARPH